MKEVGKELEMSQRCGTLEGGFCGLLLKIYIPLCLFAMMLGVGISGTRAEKMGTSMRAQDYHPWALPTHAIFSSLAFRVVSPHLLTQESITRPPEDLLGIWPGSVGQEGRQRCGERGKGER